MDAAFELVRAGPAPRALLLVETGRARARNAADRTVSNVVQRVVGNLVDLDVRPDPLLVPVGEGMDLPDAVAVGPLHLGRIGAAGRLVSADAGDPGVVRLEYPQERLHLADVAAAVGIALPQVRPLLPVLLRHGDDVRAEQLEPVALDERLTRLVGLSEEQMGVELDDVDVEPELGDHVHERRRLLLPRARQAEAVAELGVGPAEDLLRGHRLEVQLRLWERARHSAGSR